MTKCYYCNSERLKGLNRVIDFYTKEEFQYLICESCGLIQLNNLVGMLTIGKYYPQNYSPYLEQTNLSSYKRQTQAIQHYFPTVNSILDVGCGRGNFLDIVKKEINNSLVFGVEFNDEISKYLHNQLNIEIIGKTLDDVPNNYSFDLITMWDVFEHLSDPIRDLTIVNGLLNRGGAFVFSIPNIKSIDRKIFGNKWIGWDAPRHIFLFSDSLIRKILKENGFDILGVKSITGAKGSFDLSVKNVFGERLVHNPAYKVFSSLLFPYRKLAYHLNFGPVITYITQKRMS